MRYEPINLEQWLAEREQWHGREVTVVAGGKEHKRTIQGTYSDVAGGVILSEPACGFRSWNITDLKKE